MSDEIRVRVSLNTDDDGFLSQRCPSCERRFKVKFGEGSDRPISFCPYCGHNEEGCWWTQEQADYLAAQAGNQAEFRGHNTIFLSGFPATGISGHPIRPPSVPPTCPP